VEYEKYWMSFTSPQWAGSPSYSFDKMKKKQEIINGQLLGRYLNAMKAGGLECIGISQCNRGKSFSETKSLGIDLFLVSSVTLTLALFSGNTWLITITVTAILSLGYFLWWKKTFAPELKYWRMFKEAKSEIERREYAVELVFRGYSKIKIQAKALHPTDSMKESHFLVDWIRHDILTLVRHVEEGQASGDEHKSGFAKGKLEIRFTVAKHLFGYDLDFDQGYKPFFSGEMKKVMTNFV
jgi:hypothetical protein